mmetsp:Transcript_50449/g.156061  ORF Transcript_50449/g.156061 Transcript_50449/m.156061 type:complete len:414 (-) Transcript_50449:248-1489(-)
MGVGQHVPAPYKVSPCVELDEDTLVIVLEEGDVEGAAPRGGPQRSGHLHRQGPTATTGMPASGGRGGGDGLAFPEAWRRKWTPPAGWQGPPPLAASFPPRVPAPTAPVSGEPRRPWPAPRPGWPAGPVVLATPACWGAWTPDNLAKRADTASPGQAGNGGPWVRSRKAGQEGGPEREKQGAAQRPSTGRGGPEKPGGAQRQAAGRAGHHGRGFQEAVSFPWVPAPPIDDRVDGVRWHTSAGTVGQLSEDRHIFMKMDSSYRMNSRGFALSPLTILYEEELHRHSVRRYRYEISQGSIGPADGVGFVFSSKIQRTNIQNIRSIFLNRNGHICVRDRGEIVRMKSAAPRLAEKMVLRMVVDLDADYVAFYVESGGSGSIGIKIPNCTACFSATEPLPRSGFFCAILTGRIKVSLH